MTRADICMAACEGLTDAQVKTLVSAGGLIHLLERREREEGVEVAAILHTLANFPAEVAAARGNIAEVRVKLVALLAQIDAL